MRDNRQFLRFFFGQFGVKFMQGAVEDALGYALRAGQIGGVALQAFEAGDGVDQDPIAVQGIDLGGTVGLIIGGMCFFMMEDGAVGAFDEDAHERQFVEQVLFGPTGDAIELFGGEVGGVEAVGGGQLGRRLEIITVDLEADLLLGEAALAQEFDDLVITGDIELAVGVVEAVEAGDGLGDNLQGEDGFVKGKGAGCVFRQSLCIAVDDDLEEDDLIPHAAHGGLVEVLGFFARELAGVEAVLKGVLVATRCTRSTFHSLVG